MRTDGRSVQVRIMESGSITRVSWRGKWWNCAVIRSVLRGREKNKRTLHLGLGFEEGEVQEAEEGRGGRWLVLLFFFGW